MSDGDRAPGSLGELFGSRLAVLREQFLDEKTAAGVRLCFAHSLADAERERSGAHILLFGHTHEAELGEEGGALYMNPGHLKRAVDRDERASFGIVTLTPKRVVLSIHEDGGEQRVERHVSRRSLKAWP